MAVSEDIAKVIAAMREVADQMEEAIHTAELQMEQIAFASGAAALRSVAVVLEEEP